MHCHFLRHLKEEVLSVIFSGGSGFFGHIHTLFSSLSQIFTHFHPSTSPHAPPLGHIMSQGCDKEPGSSVWDWRWGGSRLLDWRGRLQPESSSVCSVCLFQCTYSGCRPVLSQRALWKERNAMLLLRTKLWWSLSVVAMLYPTSIPIAPPPFTWAERLQAPGVV